MKKFKLIGMVLVAIIMGVNFTSCKPDDEPEKPEDPVVEPTKKLVAFNETTFKYDDQGRLIECIEYMSVDFKIKYTYVWGENTIDINIYFNDNPESSNSCTLNLENGLASGLTGNPFTFLSSFKYNASNRIIETQSFMGTRTLEWNDDMLISQEDKFNTGNGSNTYTYYNNKTTKGYNPHLAYCITIEYLYVAHPELIGLATPKLIETETSYDVVGENEYTSSYRYEYEFDEDGYVNKVIVICVADDDEYIISEYIMTWE